VCEVERGGDDAVGVEAVVAVDAVEVAGLAECGDAEVDRGARGDRGEEREGVGVAVEDGDQGRSAAGGEE
jgi:hypothetical protein